MRLHFFLFLISIISLKKLEFFDFSRHSLNPASFQIIPLPILYGKFLVSIRFFILIANGSIEIDFAAISTSLSKTKTAAGLPTPLYGPVGDFEVTTHLTLP